MSFSDEVTSFLDTLIGEQPPPAISFFEPTDLLVTADESIPSVVEVSQSSVPARSSVQHRLAIPTSNFPSSEGFVDPEDNVNAFQRTSFEGEGSGVVHSYQCPSNGIGRLHPATDWFHPATDWLHPATDLFNPATDQFYPATDRLHPATDRLHPATDQFYPATDPLHPATDLLHPATDQLRPATDRLPSTGFPILNTAVQCISAKGKQRAIAQQPTHDLAGTTEVRISRKRKRGDEPEDGPASRRACIRGWGCLLSSCQKMLANEEEWEEHMYTHFPAPFWCPGCCRPFLNEDRRNEHFKNSAVCIQLVKYVFGKEIHELDMRDFETPAAFTFFA
ncbi:hypothetical protein AcV5_008735 [Taiwanofungus camphoratus]|nr:hypothetical protein AcV5_008735 [Antrodia cinnamomea]